GSAVSGTSEARGGVHRSVRGTERPNRRGGGDGGGLSGRALLTSHVSLLTSVQDPVLHRLAHVSRPYLLITRQVGQGAGQLEHPVIGPGRKPQPVDGAVEHLLGFAIDRHESRDIAWA